MTHRGGGTQEDDRGRRCEEARGSTDYRDSPVSGNEECQGVATGCDEVGEEERVGTVGSRGGDPDP